VDFAVFAGGRRDDCPTFAMNELSNKIAAEIAQRGVIGFDRFMDLALYCPVYGYYEKEGDTVGEHGDFITSVSVCSLFGELLAFQFAEWIESISQRSPSISQLPSSSFHIVEAGAHTGELAGDILSWMQRMRPELFAKIEYWIVEPSPRRQEWQRKTLTDFEGKVRWAASLSDIENRAATVRERPIQSLNASGHGQPSGGPRSVIRGVIFCNELLDAMPVRRLGWDGQAREWFEWGVGCKEERFEWKRMEGLPTPINREHARGGAADFQHRAAHAGLPMMDKLPGSFTLEFSSAAEAWWADAAKLLQWGKLVAIDYGLTEDELLVPARPEGTLRAYRKHSIMPDVLADPGEQDITAHVNFSRIAKVGLEARLETELFASQEKFLTGIAAKTWEAGARFGEWGGKEKRQFQTLTHPEHLGRAFRVLVQKKIIM